MRKRIFFICMLLLFQCTVLSGCLSGCLDAYERFEQSLAPAKELQELKAGSREEVALLTYNCYFILDDSKLNLEKTVQERIQNTCQIDRVLIYTDDVVWLTLREHTETGTYYYIVTVDLETQACDVQLKVFDQHRRSEISDQYKKVTSGMNWWSSHSWQNIDDDREAMPYETRTSFYHEGKIVISNFFTVYEYSVSTRRCVSYSYEEYEFPVIAVLGSIEKRRTELHFSFENETKVLTVEDAEKTSEAFLKMMNAQRKIVETSLNTALKENGHDTRPFYKIISTNDRTYVMCQVFTTTGWGYCVVYSYDFESNRLEFADYTWCQYAYDCQLIPKITEIP